VSATRRVEKEVYPFLNKEKVKNKVTTIYLSNNLKG
jgi:hypothetical protein